MSLLSLNVSPVLFDDVEVDAEVLPYLGHDSLAEYRRKHRDTHLFKRNDPDRMLCVPLVPNAPSLGGEPVALSLGDSPYLISSLVRDAFVAFCSKIGRPTPDYDPIVIPGDVIHIGAVAKGRELPEWLIVRTKYLVSARVMRLGRDEAVPVVALDVATQRKIDKDCQALVEIGLDITGLYVGVRGPQDDGRLAPKFRTVGRVQSVSGGKILLADSRDDMESVSLVDAELDPRAEAFDRCLVHLFGQQAGRIEKDLRARISEERSGPRRLERIERLRERLSKGSFELLPGIAFGFGPLLSEKERTLPKVHDAPGAVYVFDPDGGRNERKSRLGIENHGPYSRESFATSKPNVCVVCEGRHRGKVEKFLRNLSDGVELPPGKANPFSRGFARTYHLDRMTFRFFETADGNAASYRKAALKAIEEASPNRPWDLAIIQAGLETKLLTGDQNPYLVTKAVFLQGGVPSQSFAIEKVDSRPSDLAYILADLSLAIYAKLGGTPWLMKADDSIAYEMVVGLGSAMLGEGRFGRRERVVGITSVFRGDGNYLVSNLSKAVPIEEYSSELLASLRTSIQRAQEHVRWTRGDPVRIIFHAFKPMRNAEIDAVTDLVAGLSDVEVKFAFLHVQDSHSYMMFDEREKGVPDYATRGTKGVLVPQRGKFVHLSDRETLIALTGPKEVRTSFHGAPSPVLLQLHPASTFTDMRYLARQAYAFASHSWRGFSPSHMPVTILYSDLVADLLGKLAAVDRWNPDVLVSSLGRTRWFL